MNLKSENHENDFGGDRSWSRIRNHNNPIFRSKLQSHTINDACCNFPCSLRIFVQISQHPSHNIDRSKCEIYLKRKERVWRYY